MASKKPNGPSASKDFSLASIVSASGLLAQYSTVQVRNGSQNLLLSRAADANVSGYGRGGSGADTGATATADTSPDLATSINQNGVVRLQGTGETQTNATKAANLAAKIKSLSFWGSLPTAGKVALIAAPAAILVTVGVVLIVRK